MPTTPRVMRVRGRAAQTAGVRRPKSDGSRRGRPKLGMEAPLLAHGVQRPLSEYVRAWRRRALVA